MNQLTNEVTEQKTDGQLGNCPSNFLGKSLTKQKFDKTGANTARLQPTSQGSIRNYFNSSNRARESDLRSLIVQKVKGHMSNHQMNLKSKEDRYMLEKDWAPGRLTPELN